MEYEAGIDEAGRGPVIGPMVYGIAAWPVAKRDELSQLGFTDSKKLTEAERDALFEKIKENPDIIYEVRVIESDEICHQMLKKGTKVSLNSIAHSATFELIDRLKLDHKLNITHWYVDTVGIPDQYRQRLEYRFPGTTKFTVESKADFNYPVTSAASICAKVTRDARVNEISKVIGEIGCGYPSDPMTKAWLKDNVDPVFGFDAKYVRCSWKTCDDYIDKMYTWPEDQPEQKENDIRILASNARKSYASKFLGVNLNPDI